MSSLERLVDARLVAGLAPHQRVDDLLVEQVPDQHVAEPRVGIFLQPAGAGAILGIGREQRMAGIGFVQIGADDARIADREIAVDEHRDAAKRAQAAELVIAEEGRDRVDLDNRGP